MATVLVLLPLFVSPSSLCNSGWWPRQQRTRVAGVVAPVSPIMHTIFVQCKYCRGGNHAIPGWGGSGSAPGDDQIACSVCFSRRQIVQFLMPRPQWGRLLAFSSSREVLWDQSHCCLYIVCACVCAPLFLAPAWPCPVYVYTHLSLAHVPVCFPQSAVVSDSDEPALTECSYLRELGDK